MIFLLRNCDEQGTGLCKSPLKCRREVKNELEHLCVKISNLGPVKKGSLRFEGEDEKIISH